MKINEFMNEYSKMKSKSTASLSKLIEAKTYIPVLRKRALAEIVYASSTTIENGVVKVDSLSKYMIFTMLMIGEYTNLEFAVDKNGKATKDAINEYDMLCEQNVLNPIIACFADDYAKSNEILNYVFQDNLAVNNTVEAVVGKMADMILGIVQNLANTMTSKVDGLNFDLPEVDMDAVRQLVDAVKGNNK